MSTIESNCTSFHPLRTWQCCKKSPPSHPSTAKSVDVCTPIYIRNTIAALCHRLRLSPIAAFCHHGSLPSRLSALEALCPAIYLSDATASGRSGPKRSKNVCLSSPFPAPMHSQGCTFNPQSRCPPPALLPHPGFYVLFILYILQETARLSVCARQASQNHEDPGRGKTT